MWHTPDPADFARTKIGADELAQITDNLPEGVTVNDVIAAAYASITGQVRLQVAAGGREVGTEGQIPSECDAYFEALVMRAVFARVTGPAAKELFNEVRKQAALEAVEALAALAKHSRGIEPPTAAAPVQPSSPGATIIRRNRRRATREDLRGL